MKNLSPSVRALLAAIVLAMLAAVALGVPQSRRADAEPPQGKSTICHKTGSAKNPYVQIKVSNSGVLAGHEGHVGDVILAPVGGCGDKCPNIPGHQVVVPAGQVLDASGNCVDPPPVDVCPNIPGDQATVPPGMVVDPSGNCVTPPQPCNSTTLAGGEGTTVTPHELGAPGPVSFQFDYETFSIPDEITITYEGNPVFQVGPVGTNGIVTTTVNVPAGTATQVEVTVTGPAGTAWEYTVHCPS